MSVEVVALAGEPCPLPLALAWSDTCDFYNCCGPTEVTIVNTMQLFRSPNALTIGKPTPNNSVYILDENLQPLPIGEVGEMWAGGDCVSAGYLRNPALNRERYRLDPFMGDGRMMFRTRDLGRWNTKGELEFHGRTDDVVKIRGFRVELPAVSSILESQCGCDQAVTIKLDDRTMVSFVRPLNVDIEAARVTLSKNLPYYSVPEVIVPVAEMPLTSRGKTDRNKLLEIVKERSVVKCAGG
jgi:acyl-coenzyme A synthetase/AMP-(fatty) acid ligase